MAEEGGAPEGAPSLAAEEEEEEEAAPQAAEHEGAAGAEAVPAVAEEAAAGDEPGGAAADDASGGADEPPPAVTAVPDDAGAGWHFLAVVEELRPDAPGTFPFLEQLCSTDLPATRQHEYSEHILRIGVHQEERVEFVQSCLRVARGVAATHIQKCGRGLRTRQHFVRTAAALRVQRCWRSYAACKKPKSVLRGKREERGRVRAATVIQAAWRGHCTRRRLRPAAAAAAGGNPGAAVVRFVYKLKGAVKARRAAENGAARRIQRWVRGQQGRQFYGELVQFKKVLDAVIKIQFHYRRYRKRQSDSQKAQASAARVLRRWYVQAKRKRQMRQLRALCAEFLLLIAKIQATWRGYFFRKRVRPSLFAVLRRGKHFRMERRLRHTMHRLLEKRMADFLPSKANLFNSYENHLHVLTSTLAPASQRPQSPDEPIQPVLQGRARPPMQLMKVDSWWNHRKLDGMDSPTSSSAYTDSLPPTPRDLQDTVRIEYERAFDRLADAAPIREPDDNDRAFADGWTLPVTSSLFTASKVAVECTKSVADCWRVTDWLGSLKKFDGDEGRDIHEHDQWRREHRRGQRGRNSAGETQGRRVRGKGSGSGGPRRPHTTNHTTRQQQLQLQDAPSAASPAASVDSSVVDAFFGVRKTRPPLPTYYRAEAYAQPQYTTLPPARYSARTQSEAASNIPAQRYPAPAHQADDGWDARGSLQPLPAARRPYTQGGATYNMQGGGARGAGALRRPVTQEGDRRQRPLPTPMLHRAAPEHTHPQAAVRAQDEGVAGDLYMKLLELERDTAAILTPEDPFPRRRQKPTLASSQTYKRLHKQPIGRPRPTQLESIPAASTRERTDRSKAQRAREREHPNGKKSKHAGSPATTTLPSATHNRRAFFVY